MFKIIPYIFIITFLFLSCQDSDVLGCTDENACNYNQEATNDNNTCFYPEDWEDNCGMCDLVPSNDCEQDECGVWGGNGQDVDQDGICDDIDDCINCHPLVGTWQTSMGQNLDMDAGSDLTTTFTLTFTAAIVTWDTDVELSLDVDGDTIDDQGDLSCSSAGTWTDDGSVVTLNMSEVFDDDESDGCLDFENEIDCLDQAECTWNVDNQVCWHICGHFDNGNDCLNNGCEWHEEDQACWYNNLADAYLESMFEFQELCPLGDGLSASYTINGDTLEFEGVTFTRQ